MRLSRRGKRRALVLVTFVVLAGAAVAAIRGIFTIQQSRMEAVARRDGLAALAAGDPKLALDNLSVYLQTQKDDLEANMAYADARARQPLPGGKHLLEAVNVYTNYGLKLIERKPDLPNAPERKREILERLLDVYGQLGLRLEVVQTADSLLAIQPQSVSALAAKSEVLLLDRKFDEALPLTERLIAVDPDNLSWRRLQLEIRGGAGAPFEQMIEQCRQWAAAYKGDGRFHLLSATLLAEMSRGEEARAQMGEVLRLGADNREVLERSLSLLDLLDQREQSAALFDATKARFPDQQWVREVGVRRLLRSDRIDEAVAECAALDREFSGRIETPLQQLRAMVLIFGHKPDEARAALEPLIHAPARDREHEADRAWAVAVAGVLDSPDSNWVPTSQKLQNAMALRPNDPLLHFLMGDLCTKAGERNQAIRSYARAHELDPDWMAAGVAYVDLLARAGRADDAYRNARIVFSRAPKDRIAPFIVLVRSYLAARDAGVADVDPQTERDIISMLEQALRETGHDADITSLLASAHAVAGQPERAKELISQALADPKTGVPCLLALAEVSRTRRLGFEDQLVDKAAAAGGGPALAVVQARRLALKGKVDEGVALMDQAIATQQDPKAIRRLECSRASLLIDSKSENATEAVDDLIRRHPDAPDVLEFIMAQPEAWDDPARITQVLAHLKKVLGEQSPQARLGEATFLLRHHADDDALRAKAIMLINAVLDQSPESLAALSLMAEAITIGSHPNLDRAIECLQTAAATYPGEPAVLARLINLLQRRGDYDAASRYLRSLARLTTAEAGWRRTELQLIGSQGDLESGLARAAAIVTDKSPVADQLLLARMQQQAGRADEAGRIYQRLVAEFPADPLVLAEAADALAESGQYEKGLDVIRGGGIDLNSAPAQVLLGAYMTRHDHVEDGEKTLRRALEIDPRSVAAHDELARLWMKKGDQPQAAAVAREGLEIDPKHFGLRATYAAASLSLPEGDRRQAIQLLRELGGQNDDLAATLSLLEGVKMANGRPQPTAQNLAQAKALINEHSRYLPAWQLAISLHVEGRQLEEAASIARRSVGRFPGEVQVSKLATQLLMETGKWDDAMVEGKEWRRRSIADPFAADLALAAIEIELDRFADALNRLSPYEQRIVDALLTQPDQYQLWLHALAAAGRLDRAASLAAPLLAKDAAWRQRWLRIAATLDDSTAYEALALLDASMTEPGELLSLTSAWTVLGRKSGRAECFDRAEDAAFKIARDPAWQGRVTAAQGAIAEARGELPAAEAFYRKSIEQDPDNVVALNNLASILAANPQRAAEALPMIERAMKLVPDQPDFLDTYAATLLALNRASDAEAALNKAIAMRPDDAGMRLNWVDVQIRLDRRSEADRVLGLVELRLGATARPDARLVAKAEALRRRLQEPQAAAGAGS